MNSLLNLLSTTLSHSLMVWLINFMVLGNYGISSEGHDKKGTRGVIEIGEGRLNTGMDQLVCTPASNSLIACPGGTVSRLYRHIRQAAIPARVVLGTAVF